VSQISQLFVLRRVKSRETPLAKFRNVGSLVLSRLGKVLQDLTKPHSRNSNCAVAVERRQDTL